MSGRQRGWFGRGRGRGCNPRCRRRRSFGCRGGGGGDGVNGPRYHGCVVRGHYDGRASGGNGGGFNGGIPVFGRGGISRGSGHRSAY